MPPHSTTQPIWVLCDGTAQDAVRVSDIFRYTNVWRLKRCLDAAGYYTIYQNGVGTNMPADASKAIQWLTDGAHQATGTGLHGLILKMYQELCLQYDKTREPEIHLVGFSRGAFAVRALACLIEDIGLLRGDFLHRKQKLYDAWKDQDLETLGALLEGDCGHKQRYCDVKIASCAVFDTVAAFAPRANLKVVSTSVSGWMSDFFLGHEQLTFVKDRVPRNLEHGFQALSLHEQRGLFPPVLWKRSNAKNTVIQQCWFAGDHGDVGGGNPDCGLANITLLWMMAQYKRHFPDFHVDEPSLTKKLTPAREKETNSQGRELLVLSHTLSIGNPNCERWPGQAAIEDRRPILNLYDTTKDKGDTVHFTVRLLMCTGRTTCEVLCDYTTHASESGNVAWCQFDLLDHGISEDLATHWELCQIMKWCKREDGLFKTNHKMYFETAFAQPGVTPTDLAPGLPPDLTEWLMSWNLDRSQDPPRGRRIWQPSRYKKQIPQSVTANDARLTEARHYTLSFFLLDFKGQTTCEPSMKLKYDPDKNMRSPKATPRSSWIPSLMSTKAADDASLNNRRSSKPNFYRHTSYSSDDVSSSSSGSETSGPFIDLGPSRLWKPTRRIVVELEREDVTNLSKDKKEAVRLDMLNRQS